MIFKVFLMNMHNFCKIQDKYKKVSNIKIKKKEKKIIYFFWTILNFFFLPKKFYYDHFMEFFFKF
jgi:hypothetical protein